ncbi:hypothetical protein ES703_38159 [subsurface metagenome]
MKRDWLWDRNISEGQARRILARPEHRRFLSLSALLLARKNVPKEVFGRYIKKLDFCQNWPKIKRQMRRDKWNEPRIEYWQAIYEKLRESYSKKGIEILERKKVVTVDKFCKKIGQQIRDARKEMGLVQAMLAKKIGVKQQMISRIESGQENPSLITLKKIADKLGLAITLSKTQKK